MMGVMRVLVIEDDGELAGAIAAGLRQEQLAVDIANDGTAGLERALSLTTTSSCWTVTCRTARRRRVRELVRPGAAAGCSCSPPLPASRNG